MAGDYIVTDNAQALIAITLDIGGTSQVAGGANLECSEQAFRLNPGCSAITMRHVVAHEPNDMREGMEIYMHMAA
jgi:hypothetical protein